MAGRFGGTIVIPTPPAPWTRPRYVPAGPARIVYVALVPDAVEFAQKDPPLLRGFSIESRYQGDAPEWFEGLVGPRGMLGSQLLRTPGLDMVALAQCKAAMILTAVIEDPADLGYLQRAFLYLQLLAQ